MNSLLLNCIRVSYPLPFTKCTMQKTNILAQICLNTNQYKPLIYWQILRTALKYKLIPVPVVFPVLKNNWILLVFFYEKKTQYQCTGNYWCTPTCNCRHCIQNLLALSQILPHYFLELLLRLSKCCLKIKEVKQFTTISNCTQVVLFHYKIPKKVSHEEE